MPSLHFPPAFLFMFAALFIPFLKGRARDGFILSIPILGFVQLVSFMEGSYWEITFLGKYELVLLKVEAIRLCFAFVFVIMSFLASLFAIHIKEAAQHTAAFLYVGSSLGVVFAGDFFSLFIFWEIMAVASAAIIFIKGTKAAREAGYRYVLVHVAGGTCLMAGILFQLIETNSLAVQTPSPGLPFYLILCGFCLNAAVPPLSAWLSDAYPEASVTGSIYLTAYTTKTAVLVLALTFAGTELLVWAGAIMALYGVVFAVLENDIRRLLGYHIISQVGYMVCGVGLGSDLAINGVTSHAFSHILYKGLLFMGAGAAIHMTGKRLLTELGGIWRLMPVTVLLYMIGAFSISGVPGFNGFISKSMIISAAADIHRPGIELMLLLASIGTFLHTGLKLPYYTFFGKSHGLKVGPVPKNMTWAMGGGAFLCTLFGVYPDLLYRLLPFATEYHPYTQDHVVGASGLLLATLLAFMVFIRQLSGYPAITMDTDQIYRKVGNALVNFSKGPLTRASAMIDNAAAEFVFSVTTLVRGPAKKTAPPKNTLSAAMHETGLRDSIGVGVAIAVVLVVFYFFVFYSQGSN